MKTLALLVLISVVIFEAKKFQKNFFNWKYSQLIKATAKITFEKWDLQVDPSYAEVTHSIKDKTYLNVDSHALGEADDVIVRNFTIINWLSHFLI